MTARFEAIRARFPRWKATPEIIGDTERKLREFSLEQIHAAAAQHRDERRGDDPFVGDIVARLKGERVNCRRIEAEQAAAGRIATEAVTAEEREFDQLCDAWRADIRVEMRKPGFDWLKYRNESAPLVSRDLAGNGLRNILPRYIDGLIQRWGRQCGVATAKERALSLPPSPQRTPAPPPPPKPADSAPEMFDAIFGTSNENPRVNA